MPRAAPPLLRLASPLALVAVVLVGAGCTSTSGLSLAAPTPSASAGSQCAALLSQLGHGVGGRSRRTDVSPASPYTAAWGDPAVTLRCGVPTRDPDASASIAEVSGVEWRVRQVGDYVQWYTENRVPAVEVRVPLSDKAQENVLGDIGDAVSATIPAVTAPTDAADPEASPHTLLRPRPTS